MRDITRMAVSLFLAGLLLFGTAHNAAGYAFNETVPDVRLPAQLSGGSACPVPSRQPTATGSISLRWSTSLSPNPVTILTQDQTANGRLNEIEQVIQQSLAVWTGVSGTTLKPASFTALTRVTSAASCGRWGCFSCARCRSGLRTSSG